MRRIIVGACVLLIAFLVVTPVMAQRGVSGGDSGGSRGVDSGASSASSVSYSTASSASTASYSSSSVSYAGGGDNRAYGYSSPSGYTYTPVLQGTSFCNARAYYSWNDYYSYLLRSYGFDSFYFSRFMRNTEPLITPAVLKTTMSEPLILSRQMLRSIDELELMLADARAGKTVDKTAIAQLSRAIAAYAKAIRQNRTLSLIDVGKNMDLLTGNINAISPEGIAKLREMALDLNTQLTNLYSSSSSATISVESYRQPSFESVTKSIEKLSKAIENSSKRL